MNIAASIYIEGKIPQDHYANTKLGTYRSRKLIGMMQDSFYKDVDFYPIRRSVLDSTDDTTFFISHRKFSIYSKEN